jgi:glycosyltransferase involved in cell wall biosynthesis
MNELNSELPKVTIGLCVRNCEKTVAKTVESVTKQEYPTSSFSLIVVDGCSTDDTVGTIKDKLKYSDATSLFLSDDGRGLSFARQLAVDSCLSKYIVWIDGDNVLPPDFLRKQVEYMEKHPRVGFCGAGIVPLGESIVSRLQGYQWVIVVSDWKKAGYFMGKTGIQGTICRVDAIKSVGGFDSSIKGAGEDADLFIRMKVAGWEIGANKGTRIYHFMRDTWRNLWKESVWWGYGTYYLASKHKPFFPPLKRRAGFALLDCAKLTFKSFRLTKDLACVFMPLHYGLRRLGFLVGHICARRYGYEPDSVDFKTKQSCLFK